MVAPCPCKGRVCVCKVDGDGGITVTGNGSERQPYIPTWLLYSLAGGDSSQANVTVTGSGVSGDPWVVSIDTEGGSAVQTIYLNGDTWTKPSEGTVAHVVLIGGGGGGGATPNTAAAAGGSGGSGGAMSTAWFPLISLPATVDIKVGSGGARGRPISGLTTGENGGDSTFGVHLLAPGGRGGKSQAVAAQTQYPTLGGTAPEGGPGGAGGTRNDAAPDSDYTYSPTGGGSGEGNTVAFGTAGGIDPGRSWAGMGGSGGQAIGGSPFDGLPGHDYGGGGGGGAAAPDGTANGGDGAQGIVVVTVM